MASKTVRRPRPRALEKCPTGISGFDDITHGGVPRGRPTLVCGAAGCGKSLFGIEFIVRGATQYGEPGVLMTFEETADDIKKNVASLGFDIEQLVADGKIIIDFVRVEASEIEENGEYDLEGLFVRLNYAIEKIGAKRVMLDTIESLFSGLTNQGILRAEVRRLFGWLKDKAMTTVITGERGEGQLTRQGLEEYVSDCVILLDNRVLGQITTRRMRVVKYRGSTHGTNEYPFLIDEQGISVLPITSARLDYPVSNERVPTGVAELDAMLGGGYYRGSSIMLSGTAGTGKTSMGAHLVDATCRRGERAMFFSFEESPSQIMRNMRAIGIDLKKWTSRGLLQFHSARPQLQGLEMHLTRMHKQINQFAPATVVIDPINSLGRAGTIEEAQSMLVRLVDFLREKSITAFLVSLTSGGNYLEATDVQMSSMVDTWMLLRDIEAGGERNRGLYILKSRGMAHSNQIREFLLTDRGIRLVPAYLGAAGVLTGSARVAQESRERTETRRREQEAARRRLELDRKRKALELRIDSLRADFDAEEAEALRMIGVDEMEMAAAAEERSRIARSRSIGGAGGTTSGSGPVVQTDNGNGSDGGDGDGSGGSARRRAAAPAPTRTAQ